MAGLQRSVTSFRRQGSSGMVWDDRFLDELNQLSKKRDDSKAQDKQIEHKDQVKEAKPSLAVGSITKIERSRSDGGGRAYRTGKVSPAVEPPSPRLFACGLNLCTTFGKKDKRRPPKSGKRKI